MWEILKKCVRGTKISNNIMKMFRESTFTKQKLEKKIIEVCACLSSSPSPCTLFQNSPYVILHSLNGPVPDHKQETVKISENYWDINDKDDFS